ncbi:hypothetical protein SAMN02982929_05569 [Saccharopolyspora kobensis]|uniref:Uncharacterized protein n=2 Tax=Saccharopolyspora TaxID=1835 RepID=A0A1H6E4C4_9PSEU|nr:hypothetical protein SAMN02982929_05569 [Saccharopolyspora kobensis]SFD37997.1 hypothetical protein SAMN05216506_10498 [Saccharopolyspora kobensis]
MHVPLGGGFMNFRHRTGGAGAVDIPPALGKAMADYRALLDELESGAIDESTFRHRALRVGLVLREQDAWILDLSTERWWRYDGVALSSLRFGDAEG